MMRLHDRLRLISLPTLVIGLLAPVSAMAQVSIKTPDSVKNVSSLAVIIPRMFDIAVGIAGVLFVVLLLLGGVQYLVSLGEEEAVTKARKLMLNAGIGLVIVLSAWGVGNYVLQILGIRVNLTGGTAPGAQTSVGGGAAQNVGTTPAAALTRYNDALSEKQQAFNKFQDISNNPLATQSQIRAAQAELTNKIGGLEQARGLLGQFGVDPAGGSLSQAELATLDAAQTALGNSEQQYANIHSAANAAYDNWLNNQTPENEKTYNDLLTKEQSAQNDLYAADANAANAETDLLYGGQPIEPYVTPDTPGADQEVVMWDDSPLLTDPGAASSAYSASFFSQDMNVASSDAISGAGAASFGDSSSSAAGSAGDAGSSADGFVVPGG